MQCCMLTVTMICLYLMEVTFTQKLAKLERAFLYCSGHGPLYLLLLNAILVPSLFFHNSFHVNVKTDCFGLEFPILARRKRNTTVARRVSTSRTTHICMYCSFHSVYFVVLSKL